MTTLDALNAATRERFVADLGGLFEHSPWVAERAADERPFASVDALHGAFVTAVVSAPRAAQLELIRAHPELAGREASAGTLTESSTSEQSRLGFDRLERSELEHMNRLNRAYRERFGFPCIVALAKHATRASVQAEMQRRLENDEDTEIRNALGEIAAITRARLSKMIG